MFSTHSWAGRASLTGGTLEFGVSALAGATFTLSSAITALLVAGHTCAVVQRAITGASGPHGVTDTHSTLTASMPYQKTKQNKNPSIIDELFLS